MFQEIRSTYLLSLLSVHRAHCDFVLYPLTVRGKDSTEGLHI